MTEIVSSEPREIAPGVWWLPKCIVSDFTGTRCHTHTAPYLLLGTEETLLYDTGPPGHWPAVEHDLERLLGGRRLDWIVPSHPEVPHCGNVRRLLDRFPQARLAGDVRDYPLYFPEHADRLEPMPFGSVIELGGGRRFRFVPAPIKDLPSTQWGYEESGQILFVADAFSFTHHVPPEEAGGLELPVHMDGECTLLSSEIEHPPTLDQIQWINERALFWTRYARAEPFLKATEELLIRHRTRLIAPAHGAVIDQIDIIMPLIWQAYRGSYVGAA